MKAEDNEELKRLARVAGKNHLSSKIYELIDVHGELVNKNLTDKNEILKFITDRISMYQDIIKERYL